jgi:large subunit ribosomal protein L10
LQGAKGVFITDFQGLSVEKMNEFRQKCREASVSYRVVKNTLARLAAKKVGYDQMVDHLEGPSAIAYSYDDPSAPARVCVEFAKRENKPEIKVSLFEGVFYGPDRVKAIAALPTKDELLAQIVRGFNAPIQGFVGGLNQLLQKLVFAFDAVRNAKEKES